ncbi:MAG: NirD/YgiW/YdeI family stress tolerance protein [Desulfovibrio sp.]|nr:NirD/YgiW/YdeI family stress tolerance protein [Desulfovibrio sp.]
MRFLVMIALSLLLAMPAQAAFIGPNSGGDATTVAAAKKMRDDAYVTLTGNIVRRVRGDKYVFRDATGDIIIDIDEEDFRGQDVSPQNTVRIMGEIDKDFGRDAEVDVKSLRVIR